MTVPLRTLLSSLVLPALLTACAGLGDGADSVAPEGSAWVLEQLAGQPAPAVGAPTLRFGAQGIATQMACPPELFQGASALQAAQTVPPLLQGPEGNASGAARAGGFSLHAGIGIAPGRRQKLERLCRYVSRPSVATERLGQISSGSLRYALKTPYRDGTTHIVLEPLDLMARLAAL